MATEEVESLITRPIESDIFVDRQIVNQRLQLIEDSLPVDAKPTLAPVSSIMVQILMLGI